MGLSHTECMLDRSFSCIMKLIIGKRESVRFLYLCQSTSSGNAEPDTRQTLKIRTGKAKGRHLRPRLVQNIVEGKTSYELGWKVKVMLKIPKTKCEVKTQCVANAKWAAVGLFLVRVLLQRPTACWFQLWLAEYCIHSRGHKQ